MNALPEGVRHIPMALSVDEQKALIDDIRAVVAQAPLFVPTMPKTGKPLSVRMTNCGVLGWVTDKADGYRYQATHPVTGKSWPAMPQRLISLWQDCAEASALPEACLINFYEPGAKMGLHQDKDEQDFTAPVVSISLGDDCLFRIGGVERGGVTRSVRLGSGDIIIMGGASRLCYHGVDKIYPGTSVLLKNAGRINLTLRRVSRPSTAKP